MATWDDVRAIGLAFPEVEEAPSYDGTPALKVRGRPFCRLWGPREYARDGVHDTEVLVVFCDLEAKEALIEGSRGVLFEAPHYVGWGAVPMRLADVTLDDLAAYLEWSYRLRAPKRLIARLDAERAADDPSDQDVAPTRSM
jgi:hypothetical protein